MFRSSKICSLNKLRNAGSISILLYPFLSHITESLKPSCNFTNVELLRLHYGNKLSEQFFAFYIILFIHIHFAFSWLLHLPVYLLICAV